MFELLRSRWHCAALVAVTLGFLAACGQARGFEAADGKLPAPTASLENERDTDTRDVVFAGGCFWCMEAVFEPLRGVEDVVSGFAGGSKENAHYDLVSSGRTNHAEADRITYHPDQISYATLLHVFFSTHHPTQGDGQHPDYGTQYRPAIFYANEDEKHVAQAYIDQLNKAGVFDKPIATGLERLNGFYPAEEYHQDFVARHPDHPYVKQWALPKIEKVRKLFPELLSSGNGESRSTTRPSTRPATTRPADDEVDRESLEPVIKSESQWREELTADQFHILREEGTEPAFSSPLNEEKREGVFRCAGCGLSVFSSKTKFKSGTGWPSFYEPIKPSHITEKKDTSLGMVRTEIECARCGGHLGHVFNDGPPPTGLRYCINGDALTFEPANQ